jgi:hypothetical protein
VGDQPGFGLRPALVIDVGIGPFHGIPQSAKAGMNETQTGHADIGPVTFEHADSTDIFPVGLLVIEDDEADAITTSDQLFAEQNLLTLGSADVSHAACLEDRRVSVRCNKAYGRAL